VNKYIIQRFEEDFILAYLKGVQRRL